jgi:hypothetical protein
MFVDILVRKLVPFWTRTLDYISTWKFRAFVCLDSNDSSVYNLWVVQKYCFKLWWCNLEAADFDQFLW